MKKIGILFCVIALTVALPIAVSGCSILDGGNTTKTVNSIERISKTKSDGLNDTYTIYYTDGTTNQFVLKNGADGKDGADGKAGENGTTDIVSIWQKYCEETGTEITLQDFINAFLNVEIMQDNSKVINSCLLSSVKILLELNVETSKTVYGVTQTSNTYGVNRGSGIIYRVDSDYTYIVTNYHVMNYYPSSLDSGVSFDGATITRSCCWLYGCGGSVVYDYDYQYNFLTGELVSKSIVGIKEYDGYEIDFEYVGGSIEADIAIVRIPTTEVLARNSQAKAVTLADDYYVGETAIAIGNPEDLGLSATQGIVSVYDESISLALDGTARPYRSIRMDTSIYHGSSGGGLFNKNGELIGITNSGYVTDENINWAIPVQIVEGVANSIIRESKSGAEIPVKAKKAVIGVTSNSKNQVYKYDQDAGYGKIVEDVLVTSVTDGGIANSLDIRAGDYIKTIVINGIRHEINREYDIKDWLHKVVPGDEIAFVLKRDNETLTTNTLLLLDEHFIEQN